MPPQDAASTTTTTDFAIRMTERETRLLSSLVKSCRHYLEYGCGGSTILAAQSSAQFLVAVESDPAWLAKVKENEQIQAALSARRLFLQHVDIGAVGAWGMPVDDKKVKNWPQYCVAPFVNFDFPYDLILIDGRFRVACALLSAIFAQPDTRVAIHDYGLRTKYYNIEKYYDIVESVDSLYLMKRRERINHRSLYIDIVSNIFNYD